MSEFVEVKTADLIGSKLDWAVAKIENVHMGFALIGSYRPSTRWGQGGPLLDKHKISLESIGIGWIARQCSITSDKGSMVPQDADTALVAACRAIIASVLGETVSVPKELLS